MPRPISCEVYLAFPDDKPRPLIRPTGAGVLSAELARAGYQPGDRVLIVPVPGSSEVLGDLEPAIEDLSSFVGTKTETSR